MKAYGLPPKPPAPARKTQTVSGTFLDAGKSLEVHQIIRLWGFWASVSFWVGSYGDAALQRRLEQDGQVLVRSRAGENWACRVFTSCRSHRAANQNLWPPSHSVLWEKKLKRARTCEATKVFLALGFLGGRFSDFCIQYASAHMYARIGMLKLSCEKCDNKPRFVVILLAGFGLFKWHANSRGSLMSSWRRGG